MTKPVENFFPWRLLLGLERFILVTVSVLAVASVVATVVMRYVLKTDLYGVEEIIILLAMWLYFIGGAYGGYEGSHITADVLSGYLKSGKTKKTLRLIVAVISVLCSLVLAKWGLDYLSFSLRINAKTVSLHLPLFLSQLPIGLCFILSFIYSLYHLVNVILDRTPRIIPRAGGGPC